MRVAKKQTIILRVTDKLKGAINKCAAKQGVNVSEWTRTVLSDAVIKQCPVHTPARKETQ